jgi:hypothetical protein
MKTFVNILLITFLSACGGGSESPVVDSDSIEVVGGNTVVSDDETEVVGDNNQSNNEDLVKLNDEASALLTSFVSLRQKSFYEEFESEQKKIAQEMAAKGWYSSGNHIVAIEELFTTMMADYKIQFEDDILAIHSNGYLTIKSVDDEIKAVEQVFELYIDGDIVPDYDYFSQNVLDVLSSDLHGTLDDDFSLLRLELQNFGVL